MLGINQHQFLLQEFLFSAYLGPLTVALLSPAFAQVTGHCHVDLVLTVFSDRPVLRIPFVSC